MKFHNVALSNGLEVVAELNPNVLSVAIGFFVRTGARDETSDVSGVSHFLEHMAFKGDERYSAEDLNRVFDEIGAKYNASTSEEVTLFYGAVLPEYMERAFEMLATLIRPSLRQDDFDMEKNVILEEIGMYEDQPAFVAYENAMQTHFAGHPLGQSILGTKSSIGELQSEQMRRYHGERYRAGNIVLAVAGNTTWDQVRALAEKWCGNWPAGNPPRTTQEATPLGGTRVVTRESSGHQHVMQLAAAPSATDPLRYAAELLSVIVGDDSGSRMYWEIVDPGYAEAADLGYNEYEGSGAYVTYLSCDPESTEENLERVQKIYAEVNQNGITEEELAQAKSKIASRVVIRSERPMGRLSSLGSNWLYRREYRTVEDDLKTLQSITVADLEELLKKYPLRTTSTAAVGPLASLSGA
ncbi:MAG: M16 family metallopeptidase [Planctomycetaceae bacterium]